ncbi:MAG: hypothetical protein ACKO1H_03445 [Tabrizicola sp.]|jgi:hypothetical protein
MAATCFPYGFPTGYSRPDAALGLLWPRCVNAEPGTFGHECGQPAVFVGTKSSTGFESCFCAVCKAHGHEARAYGDWRSIELVGQGPA